MGAGREGDGDDGTVGGGAVGFTLELAVDLPTGDLRGVHDGSGSVASDDVEQDFDIAVTKHAGEAGGDNA